MEECLLARGPDETLVTIYAFDVAVWMLWRFGLEGCFYLT
jgi:hypothetical protein